MPITSKSIPLSEAEKSACEASATAVVLHTIRSALAGSKAPSGASSPCLHAESHCEVYMVSASNPVP